MHKGGCRLFYGHLILINSCTDLRTYLAIRTETRLITEIRVSMHKRTQYGCVMREDQKQPRS